MQTSFPWSTGPILSLVQPRSTKLELINFERGHIGMGEPDLGALKSGDERRTDMHPCKLCRFAFVESFHALNKTRHYSRKPSTGLGLNRSFVEGPATPEQTHSMAYAENPLNHTNIQ
jgi:hypothetical protein